MSHALNYWIGRIKLHFPNVYTEIPTDTLAKFYGIQLVTDQEVNLDKEIGYYFLPTMSYLSLRFKKKSDREAVQYGFDLTKLERDPDKK